MYTCNQRNKIKVLSLKVDIQLHFELTYDVYTILIFPFHNGTIVIKLIYFDTEDKYIYNVHVLRLSLTILYSPEERLVSVEILN